MKAFTYLILQKSTNKWYYGVRYKKGCSTNDMFTTYFSSSRLVSSLIKESPEDFVYEIRQTFNDVDKARLWESKCLRRMQVTRREDSFNKHFSLGGPIMFGDNNPSSSIAVRNKVKKKTFYRNICKLFKHKEFLVKRSRKHKYLSYIKFIDDHKPQCKRIRKKLVSVIIECDLLTSKSGPPKGSRLGIKFGPSEKIKDALKGKRYFTSPDLTEHRTFLKGEEPPHGWIRGIKTTTWANTSRKNAIGRSHTEKTKEKLALTQGNKKWLTNKEMKITKRFNKTDTVPIGWTPGRK